MYNKKLKKVIYLLNVDNFAPDVTAITYPLIRAYAAKIGAEICMITERKFQAFPPVYEKLQIYELAQGNNADWNIYIDSDTLIHPDFFDITNYLLKDTVAHNGRDVADHRWEFDRYFYRDGRHIGSCNWFTIASDWCIELWKPLDDITMEEAIARIHPTVGEINGTTVPSHLIDDFTLSRNIAKYGLKFKTILEIIKNDCGYPENGFLWHAYNIPEEKKVHDMKLVLQQWGVS
jgi:hypothetical protein